MLVQDGETRLRDTELVVPVVTGTVALYLGKKVRQHINRIPSTALHIRQYSTCKLHVFRTIVES